MWPSPFFTSTRDQQTMERPWHVERKIPNCLMQLLRTTGNSSFIVSILGAKIQIFRIWTKQFRLLLCFIFTYFCSSYSFPKYKTIIACESIAQECDWLLILFLCHAYKWFIFGVADAPTVALSFGSNLDPGNIAEGNDVYFECKISANPEVYKVVWLHNVRNQYYWKSNEWIFW